MQSGRLRRCRERRELRQTRWDAALRQRLGAVRQSRQRSALFTGRIPLRLMVAIEAALTLCYHVATRRLRTAQKIMRAVSACWSGAYLILTAISNLPSIKSELKPDRSSRGV